MTHGNDNHFDKLTFSQREGKAPLPEPMRLEYIPQKFRQDIWWRIDSEISRSSNGEHYEGHFSYGPQFITEYNLGRVLYLYKYRVLEQFHDEIKSYEPVECREFYKEFIRSRDYHQVLTLIEFVLRNEYCSEPLRESLAIAFNQTPIAYFVDVKGELPAIMPRPSSETGAATKQAIETIHEGGMDGAATHLRQAAEHINARQYADSIADSISAAESAARIIDPKASKTLGPALDSLERVGLLKHTALKEAFKKLYGYTSNEQGIRHALLDKDSADVGLDEAVFMFGACASFAAYLVSKHRQTEQQDSGR